MYPRQSPEEPDPQGLASDWLSAMPQTRAVVREAYQRRWLGGELNRVARSEPQIVGGVLAWWLSDA